MKCVGCSVHVDFDVDVEIDEEDIKKE